VHGANQPGLVRVVRDRHQLDCDLKRSVAFMKAA